MNITKLISIAVLSAIITGSANAAITEEQCRKSAKTVWADAVYNSDGTRGACIPKDVCNSTAYKSFCNDTFQNIQVPSPSYAIKLTNDFYKKYNEASTVYDHDIVYNEINDDVSFIGVLNNGRYNVFKFASTTQEVGLDGYAEGKCIATYGNFNASDFTDSGKTYSYACSNITENDCIKIFDDYTYSNENQTCHYNVM